MDLIRIKGKSKIYDGKEDEFYTEKVMIIDVENLWRFRITACKDLSQLEKEWSHASFKQLMACFRGGIKKHSLIPGLPSFKGSNDLTTYYMENEKYLAIMSFGERQPMRYQIFIEGVFEKVNA